MPATYLSEVNETKSCQTCHLSRWKQLILENGFGAITSFFVCNMSSTRCTWSWKTELAITLSSGEICSTCTCLQNICPCIFCRIGVVAINREQNSRKPSSWGEEWRLNSWLKCLDQEILSCWRRNNLWDRKSRIKFLLWWTIWRVPCVNTDTNGPA